MICSICIIIQENNGYTSIFIIVDWFIPTQTSKGERKFVTFAWVTQHVYLSSHIIYWSLSLSLLIWVLFTRLLFLSSFGWIFFSLIFSFFRSLSLSLFFLFYSYIITACVVSHLVSAILLFLVIISIIISNQTPTCSFTCTHALPQYFFKIQ